MGRYALCPSAYTAFAPGEDGNPAPGQRIFKTARCFWENPVRKAKNQAEPNGLPDRCILFLLRQRHRAPEAGVGVDLLAAGPRQLRNKFGCPADCFCRAFSLEET